MAQKTNKSESPKSKPRAKSSAPGARADAVVSAAAQLMQAARSDGWQNVLTGIGVVNKDKRIGSTFDVDTLSQQDRENLWRGDDMAARIVETVPNEMLREGYELKIQPAPEKARTMPAGAGDSDAIEPAGSDAESDPDAAQDRDSPAPAGDPRRRAESAQNRRDAFPPGQGTPPGKNAAQSAPALAPEPTKPPGVVKRKDDDAKRISEETIAKLEELEADDRFLKALEYERAFGGAGILVGADDGQAMNKPLDPSRVKAVSWLTVLSAFELYPTRYYADPTAPKYGEPEIFRIQPSTYISTPDKPIDATRFAEVHESRLLLFRGIRTSRQQTLNNNPPGWGDSVLVRVSRVLADFHLSWGSAAVLLSDFAQAVFKIKDLSQLIATDRDDVVIKRAQLIDLMRSTVRGVLLDSEEEFERKSTSLAGFHEMLEQLAVRLAAAADMPVTLLMGQSPAGLNATGESDIRFFYDRIKARQKRHLKPKLERLIKLIFLSKDGPTQGVEPENWSIEFCPLWQPSEKEQAETRLIQAQTDKLYLDAGVVTPEEIAASRFAGDTWSADTVLDFEAREESALQYEQDLAEHEAQKQEALSQLSKQKPPQAPVESEAPNA